MLPWGHAWAQQCNGAVTVTSALTISADCDGWGTKPLTLGTGANVTINSGVTVSNDAGSGRNGDPVSVLSSTTASALINNGQIYTGSQWAVTVNGTLTDLINSGTIQSGIRRAIVINGGTIINLTNTGSIIGPFSGVTNSGVIQTFNNLQGAGNANGAVTYTGALPTNYKIIINSPTTYGQLTASGVTGSMTFGIYGTSTVAAGAYTGVLSGLTVSNLTGSTSGTFGGLNWLLSLASGSSTTWDLIFSTPVIIPSNITSGSVYTLSALGPSVNPVFDGGTLALSPGDSSSQAFTVNGAGATLTTPSGSSAQLASVFSGLGGLTVNGTGVLVLTGNNTYSGGTTVASGTLTISGDSALGTGSVFVGPGGTLMGTGTINGPLTVAGTLKPGNSPGYLAANSTVTMNSGSTYLQDIAGTTQASVATPLGATGYYSFLNITGGQFVIQPNSTLTPRLTGLFTPAESGFGSLPYTPVLGDKFRIVTADGGIVGRFSTVTQPAELSAGTQFIQFYNVAGSNSLDLAVIPASYTTTLSAYTSNTRSVASALDKIVLANQAGSATTKQDQLLYAASGQNAASLPSFARGLTGEVYGATLAVVPQTTLRTQQAVLLRLADTVFAPTTRAAVHTASVGANPHFSNADKMTTDAMARGAAWGEIAYQRGIRSGDNNASGFSNNLYQLVFGVDAYAEHGIKGGGGFALSNTDVSANQGTGTVQQGSLFLYGKLPIDAFVIDGMASFGLSSADHSRRDPTGYTAGLEAKGVRGNDTLISTGLSRPIEGQDTRITPYARVTWQQVHQSSFSEGASAAALSVDSFNRNGVRGVIGLAVGTMNPVKQIYAYRFDVAVGADTSNLINPALNASLAGMSTTLLTPHAGSTFVQAGLHGTANFAKNAFAYLGVSGEARSRSTQSNVNAGVGMQF
jgi:autotransporter-associated beta strand protein